MANLSEVKTVFTIDLSPYLSGLKTMLTMTQQVEEVHDTDMRSEYRYIPLDSERINRYQEKIRLKRNKPLVNFKNTLDHTMKLKYVNA